MKNRYVERCIEIIITLFIGAIVGLSIGLRTGDVWDGILSGFLAGIASGYLAEYVFFQPRRMKRFEEERRDFGEKLCEEVTKSFYAGFPHLIAGVREDLKVDLEKLDGVLEQAGKSIPHIRGFILEYIVASISKMADTGFVIYRLDVSDYVEYLRRFLKVPKVDISATCKVRPYWFVVDGMKVRGAQITLQPYIEGVECGKGEHLPFFPEAGRNRKRVLLVSGEMIAEMLITAYLYIHLRDEDEWDSNWLINTNNIFSHELEDLPEIQWFNENVNDNNLFYALDDNNIGDRVILSTNDFQQDAFNLSIRFEFINSENGDLILEWGDKIASGHLAFVQKKHFKNFRDFIDAEETDLREDAVNYMGRLKWHLEYLKGKEIVPVDPEHIRKMLDKVKLCDVIKVIDEIEEKLKSDETLSQLYNAVVEKYREDEKIPSVEFVVTLDKRPGKAEYPVRVAQWWANWNRIIQGVSELKEK